ncbi:3'-5' exoribonuclease YhaM family protein [Neorhodopirellula pilleata]|uniref:3'-5' exoribonuclease YhaM n=1 Tax=Neorhodopirellula pilleata TaxID=2714738 RepID=A0A5C5ZRY2_9BACT|nr:OB-fold nucleic acid binding domain-containing protein [Neorhodopirellula pilleata]TWT89551.1 3'-5' exoribonuclease YhaM [Neorhodopirellula pilleata]
MSRTPINELTDGMTLGQSFQAADKQLRVNRQGGKYILLKLSDRTGTIAAMMWNADEAVFDRFDRGDFIHCQGRTQVHNGALQIIVTDIERMDSGEVSADDFERFDAQQVQRNVTRLKELLATVSQPWLGRLAEAYLSDEEFVAGFSQAAAAVSNHHAFPGGLLEHTVNMMELVRLIAPRYSELDTDLLMMGAFLHDLGKIDELKSSGEISYTDRGQLIGHIVIGIQLLGTKIDQVEQITGEVFPATLRYHLEHLIVSHHGVLEYGSPKIPVTLEAVALHHIDNLDAKLASYTSIIERDIAADGNWTNYHPAIGRKLWKKS